MRRLYLLLPVGLETDGLPSKDSKTKENHYTCKKRKDMRPKRSAIRVGFSGLTKQMRRGVERWSDPKRQSGNSALTQACQQSQQSSQCSAIAMVTAECFL